MVRSAAENARIKSEWTKSWILFSPFSLSLSLSLSSLSQSASSLCCPIVCYQTSSWRIGTKVAIVVRNCGCVRRPTCRPRATRTNLFAEFFFSLQQIFISFHNSGSQKLRKNLKGFVIKEETKVQRQKKMNFWKIVMTVEMFFWMANNPRQQVQKKSLQFFRPTPAQKVFFNTMISA